MNTLVKEKLRNNQPTFGSWVTIGHQSIIEIMATAGFEWLTLDLEHSSMDFSKAMELIAHIQSFGMAALVRVSKNEEVVIKRVMDAGADGVIVPMVRTAADAQQAVDYVKYPPMGKRGVGLSRAQNYGIGFEKYKEWQKDGSIIIAQIEHIDSVNNIDEIINTPGIDGTIVGPFDLSASMGMPGEYHRQEVKDALKRVEERCKFFNKPLGFHVIDSNHEAVEEKLAAGYTFLAFSLDFFFLGDKAREQMSLLKQNLK